MAELKTFERFQDFLDYNREEIMGNYFTYYHLIRLVQDLNEGKLELFEACNFESDVKAFVIYLRVTGNIFLYANQWDNELLKKLSGNIPLSKCRNFTFLGRKELITALLEMQGEKAELAKDRIVYECDQVTPQSFKEDDYNAENASQNDFDELVQISRDYYAEEYNNERTKTVAEAQAAVLNGIQNNKLFALRDGSEEICSVLQVINKNQSLPMIGSLYTKPDKRNKGCAFRLLHIVTKGFLLNGAVKCGLVSDATNPASNKVFLKVGYKHIYNWAMFFKE